MDEIQVLKSKKVSRIVYTARRSLKRSDNIDPARPVGTKMFSVGGECHVVAAFGNGEIREFKGLNWDKTVKDCLRWSEDNAIEWELDSSAKWRIEHSLVVHTKEILKQYSEKNFSKDIGHAVRRATFADWNARRVYELEQELLYKNKCIRLMQETIEQQFDTIDSEWGPGLSPPPIYPENPTPEERKKIMDC